MISKEPNTPSSTKKRYLFDSVFAQTRFTRHYILQLIFSTIITTLGLITNNNVVVIGAMLISPLFWPVMGIALGIITTRRNILKNAAISLAVSLVLVLVFSTVIAWLVPFSAVSQEITARLDPNIIDLFIALATSVIGVLALYYPPISATAAGVAISISLLPPLSVVGIGIALWDWEIIGKAFLLFGTNIGAIVFMGVITLYLLKIRPKKREEEVRFKYGVLISGVLMILLSIPLSLYLKESIAQNIISKQVNGIISEEIQKLGTGARVDSLSVDVLSVSQDTPLDVHAVVYLPENVYMTQSERENLLEKISETTGKDVDLSFNIISTLSLQTDEDRERSILRKNIRDTINNEFESLDRELTIDNVDISFPGTQTDPDKPDVDIVIQVKQFSTAPLSFDDLQSLKSFLELKLNITANIEIEFIPVSRLRESTVDGGTYESVKAGVIALLEPVSPDIYIDELTIKDSLVLIKMFVPSNVVLSTQTQSALGALVRNELGEEIELSLQIIRYELR